jgi:hypothetical protein
MVHSLRHAADGAVTDGSSVWIGIDKILDLHQKSPSSSGLSALSTSCSYQRFTEDNAGAAMTEIKMLYAAPHGLV